MMILIKKKPQHFCCGLYGLATTYSPRFDLVPLAL